MTLENPERTYSVIPRVAVAAQGSTAATNRRLLRTIVDNLITAGLTVRYSCDGSVAGTAGDGTNRWDDDAAIVFAVPASAHSWMVLRLPEQLENAEVLIDCGTNTTNGISMTLAAGGWTGGSTTSSPAALDGSDVTVPMSQSVSMALLVSNISTHFSVIYATDGSSFRVMVTSDVDESMAAHVLLERIYGAPAASEIPIGGSLGNIDAYPTFLEMGMYVGGGVESTSFASVATAGGPFLDGSYDNALDPDGALTLFGYGVIGQNVGVIGPAWAGYIPDFFWAADDTHAAKTIPSGTAREWAVWGPMVTPWDGTTALANGSINGAIAILGADGEGGGGGGGDVTPPTISNITPAPSSTLATRRTPISFDVADAAPGLRMVLITLRYVSSPGTFVVHDGTSFLYPFDSSDSVREETLTGYHFTILPRRGWAGDIDQMFVYAIDQDGNLEGSLPVEV